MTSIMLSYLNSYDNVGHSFEVIDQHLGIIHQNGSFAIYHKFKEPEAFMISGDFTGLGRYSDGDFYVNEGHKSAIVSIPNFVRTDQNCKVEVVSDHHIVCTHKDRSGRSLVTYNREKHELWKIRVKRGRFLFTSSDHLFGTQYLNDSELACHLLADGTMQWTYDLSSLGIFKDRRGQIQPKLITNVIGSLGNELWLYLNDNTFLTLDIPKGSASLNVPSKEMGFRGNLQQAHIEQEEGVVYGLFRHHLSVLHLGDRKAETEDLRHVFSKYPIESRRNVVKLYEWLFFADDYYNKVGAFNLKTKQIDWIYEFSQEGIDSKARPRTPREIRVYDGRLYVLDNKNTLHVFAKD